MSDQGTTLQESNRKLLEFDEDDPARARFTDAKRYQSDVNNFVALHDKIPSINESFHVRGQSDDFDYEEEKDQMRYLEPQNRSSRVSQLSDEEDSLYRSSPRVNVGNTTDFEVMNDKQHPETLDSGHEAFNMQPENSKHLPNARSSSSLVSSSKTSVGFLKDFYYQLVELIKYRN